MEITIHELWNVLKKSFLFVLIFTVLFGAVAYVYTSSFAQKVYTSSTDYVLIVKDSGENSEPTSVEKLNNALVVGGKSIMTLSSYLMTESTMSSILRYLEDMHKIDPENEDYITDYTYTSRQLLGCFSFIKPEEETDLVFGASCRAYTARDARVLLKAFGAVINERADSVLKNVFVIEECDPPINGTLTSPHVLRTTILSAIIGALIPYIFSLVVTVLDTRIKKEEDLKNNFDHPLLGQIPHF